MLLGEFIEGAYNSWLGDALSCCSPRLKAQHAERRGVERDMAIIHDRQPQLVPPPRYDPVPSSTRKSKELLDRGRTYASQVSKRGAFSVRRRLNAYNGHSRRPHIGAPMQISGPSDFQHVARAIPRRTNTFRPLQLSIYLPDNQLSPILPHFGDLGDDDSILSYPNQAVLLHSRSASALSNFTIPRKPLRSTSMLKLERGSSRHSDEHESPSSNNSEWAVQPLKPRPRIPESPSTQELMAALEAQLPKAPPAARLKSIDETPLIRAAEQYGRVKSALIERQELDDKLKKLDTIIEQRRSIYLSRSSRGVSIYNQEPAPRPSLPTRDVSTPVQAAERPNTAPGNPRVRIPHRVTSLADASVAFNSHPISHDHSRKTSTSSYSRASTSRVHSSHGSRSASKGENSLPPPLPLKLQSPQPSTRSPSRPKRSLSKTRRVSNWLFMGSNEEKDRHRRSVSIESITNYPRNVTIKEGFYQCVDYGTGPNSRTPASNQSLSTVMTQSFGHSEEDGDVDHVFESDMEGDEGTRTAPTTTWSPSSSPGRALDITEIEARKEMDVHVTRMRSFDDVEISPQEKELPHLPDLDQKDNMVIRPNRTSVGVAF